MKGFTVVIPVYNEEELITDNTKKLINFLDALKIPYEIIIGDNGSTDSTYQKGKKLMENHPNKVRFFYIRKKGSVGTVFKKAVLSSIYEKIITMDMDLLVDLNFIPRCIDLLDEYNMVIGSKRVGSQDRPLLRKLISDIFIKMVEVFLGLKFKDYSLACKGYRRSDVIDEIYLIDKGSSYVIALAFVLKRKGLKIKEIPVLCFDRRKSKFNIIGESIYRLRNLIIFLIRIKTNNS